MWQKRILLTLIEAVDFIDKQDGATSGIAVLPGALDGFADLFYARRHCGDAFHISLAVTTDNFGQRGFSCPWRPPQDHRMQMPGLDSAWQRFTGSQQMLLPNIFCQRDWPHTGGQRLKFIVGEIQRQSIHANLTDADRPASRLLAV